MVTRLSRFGRIAVIALPIILVVAVGSWGAPANTTPPPEQGLVLGTRDTLVNLYLKGGVVMHFITLCSILALGVFLERLANLRKGKIISSQFLEEIRRHWYRREVNEAIAVCKSHDIALARILRAGLLRFTQGPKEIERAIQDAGRREATLLRKNLGLLAFLANMAPMLGLFGTVLGMIKSFDAIAIYGQQGNVGFVASGIAEALITTAWGLMVGIPALGLYYYFRRKIELRVLEMEGVCVSFLEDLAVHRDLTPSRTPDEKEPVTTSVSANAPAAVHAGTPAAVPAGVRAARPPWPAQEWDEGPGFRAPTSG
ncbi:MAG: MotA/TolQ/ExbB proton channel family protein [Candidatus Methylomirabilales bacterium]